MRISTITRVFLRVLCCASLANVKFCFPSDGPQLWTKKDKVLRLFTLQPTPTVFQKRYAHSRYEQIIVNTVANLSEKSPLFFGLFIHFSRELKTECFKKSDAVFEAKDFLSSKDFYTERIGLAADTNQVSPSISL